MPATAYTGAELRVRDKAIEEKHAKELAALEAKNGRLRHALDQRSEEYFHLQNYGERIAGLLGFRTLGEVQMFIDLADEQIQYKDLASRVEGFKEELTVERRNRQALENDLADVTEERDALKVALAKQSAKSSESGASAESLAKELVDLQSRHDETNERAARADAEFKIRTAKWKAFKQWMQAEEKQYREKRKGFTTAENIRDRDTYYQKRQKKVEEVGFDSSEDEHAEGVEVNEVAVEDKPSSSATAMLPSSPTVVMTADTTPVTKKHSVPPVGTPRTPVVASTRTPLQLFPIFKRAQGSTAPSSTLQPNDDSVIDLSETQTQTDEDSQEFPWTNNLRDNANTRPPLYTNTPIFPPSTERQRRAPYSPISARPDPAQLGGTENEKKRRRSEFGTSTAHHEDRDKPSPRKVRRFSSPIRKPLNEIRANEPHPSRLRDTPDSRPGRGRDSRGRDTENSPACTPANTSSSKPMTDYSAFKGRGRYGKAAASGNDTINASYAIDPTQNQGVNYQFDAVVRRKEDRRRMDGGDCEECRDYYDALGPMPSRLQPPLWRSPQKSHSANTSVRRTCRHGHGRDEREDENDEAIQSHKQAISRHRHNWAQGSTPPDYWNIGFPSTQEAQVINERAAEMHQQKLKQVQREAEGGGKYYKTRH